jgi:hypothetical protein
MLRVAGVLLGLALYIWFVVDVVRTPSGSTRTLPKWVWLLVVVVLPLLGGVLWFIVGRPRRERPRFGGGRRQPMAPDDDPNFLKDLDQQAWQERMRRRRNGGTDPAAT